MHNFHLDVVKRFNLNKKANLLGMSRGGLYAFNYAIFYPEYVDKMYLDAPVLDLKTWPPVGSLQYDQLLNEYQLNADTYATYKFSPIDKLDEYFALNIPTLIVAGCADEVVPFDKNSKIMIDFAKSNDKNVTYYLKPECKHHPHSLEDVTKIVEFFEK
jgi:alpha-beta hydrolase superfamily lysophospholipase